MFLRRQVPFFITVVVALIMIIAYFTPHPTISPVRNKLQDWFMIIAAFTMIVGILSLIKVNIKKIRTASAGSDKIYSLVTLSSLFIMIFFGLLPGAGGINNSVFKFMFNHVMVPLQATMFSLLAFYIASASFRAFRAKSTMATLLLITAFIVMLGRVPFGRFISGPHLSNITEWIMNVVNMAGQRAILIGAALGVMATSVKIVLGIERSHLGGE